MLVNIAPLSEDKFNLAILEYTHLVKNHKSYKQTAKEERQRLQKLKPMPKLEVNSLFSKSVADLDDTQLGKLQEGNDSLSSLMQNLTNDNKSVLEDIDIQADMEKLRDNSTGLQDLNQDLHDLEENTSPLDLASLVGKPISTEPDESTEPVDSTEPAEPTDDSNDLDNPDEDVETSSDSPNEEDEEQPEDDDEDLYEDPEDDSDSDDTDSSNENNPDEDLYEDPDDNLYEDPDDEDLYEDPDDNQDEPSEDDSDSDDTDEKSDTEGEDDEDLYEDPDDEDLYEDDDPEESDESSEDDSDSGNTDEDDEDLYGDDEDLYEDSDDEPSTSISPTETDSEQSDDTLTTPNKEVPKTAPSFEELTGVKPPVSRRFGLPAPGGTDEAPASIAPTEPSDSFSESEPDIIQESYTKSPRDRVSNDDVHVTPESKTISTPSNPTVKRKKVLDRLKDDYLHQPEVIPRDMKTFVMRYRGIKYSDAKKYIPYKEIDRSLKQGEVLLKNNRLW